MKKIIVGILSLIMIFGLVACGLNGTKYTGQKAEYAGIEASLKDHGITKDTYIVLGDNDQCEFAFNGKVQTGTYKADAGAITITIGDSEYSGTKSGSEIILSYLDSDSTQEMNILFVQE